MNAQQLWEKYCIETGKKMELPYQAWQFGGTGDELAGRDQRTKRCLRCRNTKTATASAYRLYEIDNEPLPKEGDYSVILNSKEEALCIIRTTKVAVVPFFEVSEDHAYKEGEGDRTLTYWKAVHEYFFKKEYEEYGLPFDLNDVMVVTEEFELVYKA